MSASVIMPAMPWPAPTDLVGSFQPFSQPVMVSISGPWAALILVASAVTAAGMSCFASIVSLMSTAWAWCGIIIWANVTSAALWSAAAAGALLAERWGELPWSMPGMEVPEDPVRIRRRSRPGRWRGNGGGGKGQKLLIHGKSGPSKSAGAGAPRG